MAQTYDYNYNHSMFDSADYAYFIDSLGARFFNVGGCCPEFIPVPGEPVPEHMPYAKYINDTSMWEWKTVKLADFWEEKIYDLKPQYKDTLIRIDGSVIEVPLWIKDPDWVKEN